MNRPTRSTRFGAIACAAAVTLAAAAGTANAQSLTTFTYQGVLESGSGFAQGVHQVRFRLYNSAVGGVLLCEDIRQKNFSTDDQGRFTFDDLDCAPFNGGNRWVEISVRQGTSGPFTVLGPRQLVNASPYSFYADNSGTSLDDAYENGTFIDADLGPVRIGGGLELGQANTIDGEFDLFSDEAGNRVFELFAFNDDGASARWYEEDGSLSAFIEPDINGEGTFFQFTGGSGSVTWDGNTTATNGGNLTISGPGSNTTFATNNTGDSAVFLPNSAVSSGEMSNEPGVASNQEDFLNLTFDTADGITTILSRTITAPSTGFVIAFASLETRADHISGTDTDWTVGISRNPTAFDSGLDYRQQVDASDNTDFLHDKFVTIVSTFPVSAGNETVYVVGRQDAGGTGSSINVSDIELTLLFVPTAYGIVELPGAAAPAGENQTNIAPLPRTGMTPAEINREIDSTDAANQQALRDELDAMSRRLADLEAQLQNAVDNQTATNAAPNPN